MGGRPLPIKAFYCSTYATVLPLCKCWKENTNSVFGNLRNPTVYQSYSILYPLVFLFEVYGMGNRCTLPYLVTTEFISLVEKKKEKKGKRLSRVGSVVRCTVVVDLLLIGFPPLGPFTSTPILISH
jgi:hypothetical protein